MESTIEPFNASVLCWLTRLDVGKSDLAFFCPMFEPMRDQLRSIVRSYLAGTTSPGDQHLQHPDDAFSGQRSIYFDPQGFPIEVIQNVQGSKGSARSQTVTHEVQRPTLIGVFWLD